MWNVTVSGIPYRTKYGGVTRACGMSQYQVYHIEQSMAEWQGHVECHSIRYTYRTKYGGVTRACGMSQYQVYHIEQSMAERQGHVECHSIRYTI